MNQTRSPPVINFFKFLLQQKRRDAKEISVEVKKQTVENHSENRTPPPNLTDP